MAILTCEDHDGAVVCYEDKFYVGQRKTRCPLCEALADAEKGEKFVEELQGQVNDLQSELEDTQRELALAQGAGS